ncbi:MAG: DUF5711 family protein [Candidatus Choladocola sp.]|nr:DUF5711 family protein [Candidatus Choladocola sp.]
MNRDKFRDISDRIREKLQFLKIEDDLEDDLDEEDDLQIEEKNISPGSTLEKELPEEDFEQKLASNRKRAFRRRAAILILAVCVIGGFVLYNVFHTFRDYVITESYENTVSSGTKYETAGKNMYRYNSDGVSCITRKNDMKWSITYNMQAPISDLCGNTLAIAEQQGNQIYVVNEDGLIGNFETLLPILKVRVSRQGVVAVVLQEGDITWINLYRADGTTIASDKTTVGESGYPLDIDISPDGEKLAVSYLGIKKGIATSDVVFYHFGSAGQTEENHVVSSSSYAETVIPQIYFTGNSRAVAVADNGYIVFQGSDAPKQTASVEFEEEIISTFHDDERIGFLFRNESEEYNYRMELYNYRGRKKASRGINTEFDEVKMENGQILMFSDKQCQVYTGSGRLRFSSAYEKEIVDMFYFSEFRKYLVITRDSFDRIRIS